MAMPRPSGKALKIAQKVVPGLTRGKSSDKGETEEMEFLSEVEIKQTRGINNKEGIIKKDLGVKI